MPAVIQETTAAPCRAEAGPPTEPVTTRIGRSLRRHLTAPPLSWRTRLILWGFLTAYLCLELASVLGMFGETPVGVGRDGFAEVAVVGLLIVLTSISAPAGTLLMFVFAFGTVADWYPMNFAMGFVFIAACLTRTATWGFTAFSAVLYLAWAAAVVLTGHTIAVVLVSFFLVLVGTTIGWYFRAHDARVRKIVEDLDRQAEIREEAVAAERRRIASEMHDVVAHGMTVVAMQCSVLETLDEPEARRSVQRTIREAAGQSLVDLRRLLVALHGSQRSDGADVPDGGQGLDALRGFAERLEEGGYTVRLRLEAPDELQRSLELTVLRVVQESVTNILKHGPGEGEVRLEVVADDGRVRVEVSSPLAEHRRERNTTGAGMGLAGMEERVRVFDGTLGWGPAEGRWLVSATLPLRARA